MGRTWGDRFALRLTLAAPPRLGFRAYTWSVALAGTLWTLCPTLVARNAPETPAAGCGVWATFYQKVVLCIDNSNLRRIEDSILRNEVERAIPITSRMLTAARVKVQWEHEGSLSCSSAPDRASIIINLLTHASSDFRPGALPYCLPDEGRHIVVLCDRILSASPELSTPLLAHVIAHEITHLLQGSSHHSAEGIMKTQWDHNDYAVMKLHPLAFTETDLRLIRDGLARHGQGCPQI
jgi:hypothetical protein